MKKALFFGLIAGFLYGSGLTYYISNEKFKEEAKFNLSKNITNADLVKPNPPNLDNISLPNEIKEDEAIIMVYVSGIGGYNFKLPVSTKEYFKYKKMTHTKKDLDDLVNFVTYNNKGIRKKAKRMTEEVNSPEEKAQLLHDFVLSHIYDASIEKDKDYVKYPIETMVERSGDCEDFAILGAALMKSIDLDVALILFPPPKGKNEGHMGIGVNGNFSGHYFNIDGKKYFYAEPTGTDWLNNKATWKIGEMPDKYVSRKANIYIVN